MDPSSLSAAVQRDANTPMPIPNRPTFPSLDPRWQIRITDDNSPTLVQASSNDAMHSGCGAIAETRHVYLVGSGAAGRLADGAATRVLELGFGSGMGWLLTADAALASAAPLFYLGLENQLPPAAVIRQLELGRFIRCSDLLIHYCSWLESLPHCDQAEGGDVRFAEFKFKNVTLRIELGDAVAWCQSETRGKYSASAERFDAIYFDPYSPETDPRLWQSDIFAALCPLLSHNGSLVSYCVSRRVRDNLQAAGLVVSKFPGPRGGKREVLLAQKLRQEQSATSKMKLR